MEPSGWGHQVGTGMIDYSWGVGVTVRKATGAGVWGGSRKTLAPSFLAGPGLSHSLPGANASQVPAALGPGRGSQHLMSHFLQISFLCSERLSFLNTRDFLALPF